MVWAVMRGTEWSLFWGFPSYSKTTHWVDGELESGDEVESVVCTKFGGKEDYNLRLAVMQL